MAAKRVSQGAARRASPSLTPLRWQHSQKLAGYYDADRHALIYQDAGGREVDRVDLPSIRTPLTKGVE